MEPNLICNLELLRWELKVPKTPPLQDDGSCFCVPLKLERGCWVFTDVWEMPFTPLNATVVVNWTIL